MKTSELIKSLASHLEGLTDHLDAIDDAEGDHADATARLAALQKQTEDAEAEHRSAVSNLARVQADLAAKTEEGKAAHSKAISSLQATIESAKSQLADLTSQVNSKRVEHNAIVESLESLKKRLVG